MLPTLLIQGTDKRSPRPSLINPTLHEHELFVSLQSHPRLSARSPLCSLLCGEQEVLLNLVLKQTNKQDLSHPGLRFHGPPSCSVLAPRRCCPGNTVHCSEEEVVCSPVHTLPGCQDFHHVSLSTAAPNSATFLFKITLKAMAVGWKKRRCES